MSINLSVVLSTYQHFVENSHKLDFFVNRPLLYIDIPNDLCKTRILNLTKGLLENPNNRMRPHDKDKPRYFYQDKAFQRHYLDQSQLEEFIAMAGKNNSQFRIFNRMEWVDTTTDSMLVPHFGTQIPFYFDYAVESDKVPVALRVDSLAVRYGFGRTELPSMLVATSTTDDYKAQIPVQQEDLEDSKEE